MPIRPDTRRPRGAARGHVDVQEVIRGPRERAVLGRVFALPGRQDADRPPALAVRPDGPRPAAAARDRAEHGQRPAPAIGADRVDQPPPACRRQFEQPAAGGIGRQRPPAAPSARRKADQPASGLQADPLLGHGIGQPDLVAGRVDHPLPCQREDGPMPFRTGAGRRPTEVSAGTHPCLPLNAQPFAGERIQNGVAGLAPDHTEPLAERPRAEGIDQDLVQVGDRSNPTLPALFPDPSAVARRIGTAERPAQDHGFTWAAIRGERDLFGEPRDGVRDLGPHPIPLDPDELEVGEHPRAIVVAQRDRVGAVQGLDVVQRGDRRAGRLESRLPFPDRIRSSGREDHDLRSITVAPDDPPNRVAPGRAQREKRVELDARVVDGPIIMTRPAAGPGDHAGQVQDLRSLANGPPAVFGA